MKLSLLRVALASQTRSHLMAFFGTGAIISLLLILGLLTYIVRGGHR